MNIPKSITIAGQLISLKVDNTLERTESLGTSDNILNEIKYCQSFKGDTLPKSQIELNVLHEITHHILDKLGYHTYSRDEKFVEQFALLLHQVLPYLYKDSTESCKVKEL